VLLDFPIPEEKGEQCNDRIDNDGDQRIDVDDPSCSGEPPPTSARCGDGLRTAPEECDDGNKDDTDACLSTCKAAICGDGALWRGIEMCDDGNRNDGDACLNGCQQARCGDGVVHKDIEPCDDANHDNSDACLEGCVPARCGDFIVQLGVELCDDGNLDDGDDCPTTCQKATCGDGKVRRGLEECDDGNGVPLDGCELGCTFSCGSSLLGTAASAMDAASGHCYARFDNPTAQESARGTCQSLGGHLVVVMDRAENDLVRTLFTPPSGFWMGANDIATEGTFLWDDDEPFHFKNFREGEPNGDASENCVHMLDADGSWNDLSCVTSPLPYVCEFEPGPQVFRETTAPKPIVKGACTTASSNSGRKIAIDAGGNLYAALLCEAASVAVSKNGGKTFGLPVKAAGELSPVTELAIVGGPPNVAYAVVTVGDMAYVSVTSDAGATWTIRQQTGPIDPKHVSIAALGRHVWVATQLAGIGQFQLLHSIDSGNTFQASVAVASADSFDIHADPATQEVFLATADPTFHLLRSTDLGANFGPETNPPGMQVDADWHSGGGFLAVTGSGDVEIPSDTVHVIDPRFSLEASTTVTGLVQPVTKGRAITLDDRGNLYTVQQSPSGEIRMDFARARATTFSETQILQQKGGTFPGIVALPRGLGAAVLWESSGEIMVTVRVLESLTGTGADGPCADFSGTVNIGLSSCAGRSTPDAVSAPVGVDTPAGTTEITLKAPTPGFAAGDEVLIIDLQGTPGNTSGVGLYEFRQLKSASGSSLGLTRPLTNRYDGSTDRIVVQRVPQYTRVSVSPSASLTTFPWNGETGGVLVFRASGTVRLDGNIDVSGAGYRGGLSPQAQSQDGFSGESIHGGLGKQDISSQFGAGGAGRGELCATWGSSGGGGAHLGGGESGSAECSGRGGTGYGFSDPVTRLYFGSGGGSGGNDQLLTDNPPGGSGGHGGGIVMIVADAIFVGSTGSLRADGTVGQGDAAPGCMGDSTLNCWDFAGAGGGGAGGSLLLMGRVLVSSGPISALGGAGGQGGLGGNGGNGAMGQPTSLPF
jgi:cysteine-rich repeat protein